jgi:hypothetical protein
MVRRIGLKQPGICFLICFRNVRCATNVQPCPRALNKVAHALFAIAGLTLPRRCVRSSVVDALGLAPSVAPSLRLEISNPRHGAVERNVLAEISRMPHAGNCGRKRLRVIHRFGGYPCGLTRDCRGRRAYSWIANILCSECGVLQCRATGRTAGFQPRLIAHSLLLRGHVPDRFL